MLDKLDVKGIVDNLEARLKVAWTSFRGALRRVRPTRANNF
jgi:hypothetical protein